MSNTNESKNTIEGKNTTTNTAQSTVATKEPAKVQSEDPNWAKEVSRVVYIRRRPLPPSIPGQNVEEAKSKIGSSFKGGSVLRGLTFEEEVRFLQGTLGINKESQNWEKATKDYWSNITKYIPSGDGLKLEIGFRYVKKADYEADLAAPEVDGAIVNPKGTPINLDDYILWRYCLLYSEVARNVEDVGKSPKIRFYIFSKDKEVKDKTAKLKVKKEAEKLYNQRIGEREWVHHMLTTLVADDKRNDKKYQLRDLRNVSEDEKDIALDEYLTLNPTKFLEVGEDRHLETKAFIEQAILNGKLHRIPNTSAIVHDGVTIGNTMEQAVAFFNNTDNVEWVRTIKAQVKLAP